VRESNVCALEWTWEVAVPEVGWSVFVIPPEAFKSKRAHVVVLNDDRVVNYRDTTWFASALGVSVPRQQVGAMNNTAWQRARREAGLRSVRIHELRHTFACRLRAAGVTAEDREVLLGHANHSMAGHYASADVGRLLGQANLVLNRQETRTVLRVANGPPPGLCIKGPAEVRQQEKGPQLQLVNH
jgi:integrase